MCCCCPSAKFRRPEFGNDNYEKAATILTVVLFLLVFPELIAYATLTDVYVKGDAVQCCGMITEKSIDTKIAPCKEKDFPDSIPKIGNWVLSIYFCYLAILLTHHKRLILHHILRNGGT